MGAIYDYLEAVEKVNELIRERQEFTNALILSRKALNTITGHHCWTPGQQELVSKALREAVRLTKTEAPK